ncbi:hypothetical protein B0O80DRAFT_2380 [Mortierella sp. GBAus27b]|nr:hypothetical protein B0O80DRAFT_2380 [Mortierella sp. GBAus27b]
MTLDHGATFITRCCCCFFEPKAVGASTFFLIEEQCSKSCRTRNYGMWAPFAFP